MREYIKSKKSIINAVLVFIVLMLVILFINGKNIYQSKLKQIEATRNVASN